MSKTPSSAPVGSADPSDAYPTVVEVLRELDEQGVLLVTWNRPERNNAWTSVLQNAYLETLIAAANDPRVRVIVVTGAGKTFCPGRDMQALQEGADGDSAFDPAAGWPLITPRLVPKPVIMAVNGACAGLGMVQVASADVVFASTTARFTTAFARRGLTAEYGIAWLLPRLVGTANALDLLLSARVVEAAEAKEMGLVSRIVEPDQLLPTALAYARDVAVNCSPRAMAQIKRQVLGDWERRSEEARLHALSLATAEPSPDLAEGVASFKEKRPPRFPGVNAQIHPLQSGTAAQ